jgi:hypothetical protein
MDKAELDRFIRYYRKCEHNGRIESISRLISHLYEKFGREFIHNLPVECTTYRSGNKYLEILGTRPEHSTTGPAYRGANNQYRFYILGYHLSLDEWLPLSALSPEEQIMFKLKYG